MPLGYALTGPAVRALGPQGVLLASTLILAASSLLPPTVPGAMEFATAPL